MTFYDSHVFFHLGGITMRRNRKLSRKKIILGSIAAVLVVATACGVVVAMHRKTPNSGTGQSITLEQSDYEEKKNDAIQQIQNTVKTLSENQQQKVSAYVEQNIKYPESRNRTNH